MPPRPPKPAPYPNAHKVLDTRPLPLEKLSGVRHVPTLIYADGGHPFLRFKKPQSPFLARILRQKVKTKQRRFNELEELEETFAVGEHEERWEDNLKRPFGMEENGSMPGSSEVKSWDGKLLPEGRGEMPWQMVSYRRRGAIFGQMGRDVKKAAEMGQRMMEILEREKELAEKEGRERRHEKKQEKWKKREEKRLREKIESGEFEKGII